MASSLRSLNATSPRSDQNSTPAAIERRKGDYLLSPQLPPSPAHSDIAMRQASPWDSPSNTMTSAMTREEQRLINPIDRGAPGDAAIFSEGKTAEQKDLAKRKSQYYGDVFAHREPTTSARERIMKESMVMADVRTNVIIQDEYTFITDLSYYLSTRYQRPENSIVVSLTHSCCLLFGGNFEPAYTMTITALASQLGPVTNKRNAALLGTHMSEELGVNARRGAIKFQVIAEENLANDGRTVAGEIEELEKEISENNLNLQRSLSRGTTKSRKRQSMKSLRGLKNGGQLSTHNESMTPTPPMSRHENTPPMPDFPPPATSKIDRKAEKVQKMGKRKSFIATIFGKGD